MMNSIHITPEEAKKIIQDAQEEILESYDGFVGNLVKGTISEGKAMIESDEKEEADMLLKDIDQ